TRETRGRIEEAWRGVRDGEEGRMLRAESRSRKGLHMLTAEARFFAGLLAMMNLISPLDGRTASAAEDAADAGASKLVEGNSRFAIDVLRRLNGNSAENAFFSPYSVSTALAMTWAGARGETAVQMAKVLHVSDLAAADVPGGFRGLQKALAQTQEQTG